MRDNAPYFGQAGRNKFLEKKKKEKDKHQVTLQNNNLIVKVQKNIRRYLHFHREQPRTLHSQYDLLFLNAQHFFKNPQNFLEYFESEQNCIPINKRMCLLVINFMMETHKQEQMNDEFSEKLIKHVLNQMIMNKSIFESLNKKEKTFFIHYFLIKSEVSFLNMFDQKTQNHIFQEITKDINTYVQYISQGSALAIDLLFTQHERQVHISTEATLSQMILSTAYANVHRYLKNIQNFNFQHKFLLYVLNFIIENLAEECQLTILEQYKIQKHMLEVDEKEVKELIREKDQWVTFLDFLNFSLPFYSKIIETFIEIPPNSEICEIVITTLEYMPREYEIKLKLSFLEKLLFQKLTRDIKVHLIEHDLDQQKLLLSVFLILEKIFAEMSDLEFMSLFGKDKKELEKLIKNHFMKLLGKIIFVIKPTKYSYQISKIGIILLQNLYNKSFRTHLVNTEVFVNDFLTQKFLKYNFNNTNDEIDMFIKNFPYIFPLNLRLRKFRKLTREHHYYYDEDDEGMAGKVRIRRNHEFEDAFNYLYNKNMKRNFAVVFVNQFGMEERGIDAGGLIKQFINRVLKAIFKEQFGMFIQNHEKELIPHPRKTESSHEMTAKHYEFIGKIIGKALLEGITIGPKFSGAFLNALIGKKNSFEDLRTIDSILYKNLLEIKNMKEDAKQLYLTFEYRDEERKKLIHLKPNGPKIKVTNENKIEYINLIANYKVNRLLEYQSRHIRKGLTKVINREWLFMFNYEELNYLISGAGEISIEELRKFSRYSGYTLEHPTIQAFWNVVFNFNEEEKSNLLMFVTSCPRPSFLGFEDLSPPFTIAKNGNSLDSLPISHTCGNVLELPDYRNEELLRIKLLMAINSKSGFELA